MRKVISQLKGTKVLILGNHDKGITTMYNCGFDVVLYSASIYIGKERVTMTHCPLRGVKREDITNMRGSNPGDNWHGESREKHKMCSITDEGQYHIHGHTHNREGKDSSVKILGKQFDIGVTCNKYTPVSISQIESWISNDIKSRK